MRRKYLIVSLFIAFTLVACAPNNYTIEPDDALRLLEENESAILLDVRTQTEYEEEHIPGSLLIPLAQLENNVENIIQDKDTIIIIYCRSGNRSLEAIEILKTLNYTTLYDLGGILDWPYDVNSCDTDC